MHKGRKEVMRAVVAVIFFLYLAGLIYFLFFSERYGRTEESSVYRYNLHLFAEIKRYFTYRKNVGVEYFVVNIFGNVLAFLPFGFLLPLLQPKLGKFVPILLLSALLSLTIETMQLLLKVGCFDVDDLLMNTLGGILGYIFFCIGKKIRKKK